MQTWNEFNAVETDIICPYCWHDHKQTFLYMEKEPDEHGSYRYECIKCHFKIYSRKKWTHKKED